MTESVAGTYRADLASLATLGAVKFNDGVSGLLTTAHPTLMDDGTLINITNGVCCSDEADDNNHERACHHHHLHDMHRVLLSA